MKSSPARVAYDKAYYAAHKEAKNAYSAAHYADHREEMRDNRRDYYEDHKGEILEKDSMQNAGFTEWLQILRDGIGCQGAGPHKGRLEHHHVDPSTKFSNIAQMHSYSQERLLDEIAKCVVLCMSCHHTRHAAMRLEGVAA